MIQDLLAMFVVFGLLGAAVVLLRKKGALVLNLPTRSGGSANDLTVRARLQLTPQHSLHWVRAGDREILLALHPGGCTVLSDEAKT